MNGKTIMDTALVGRTLLTKEVFPRFEAFSGNGLYCGRGMPTMKKYKTVKEVCDLTGLTGKHRYFAYHPKLFEQLSEASV